MNHKEWLADTVTSVSGSTSHLNVCALHAFAIKFSLSILRLGKMESEMDSRYPIRNERKRISDHNRLFDSSYAACEPLSPLALACT